MGLSVLPGRGDNRETGARPVQSRCRKEQLFSTRNAATGKPGRRRQGVNSEPEYLPTFMFRAALRTTEMRKKAGRRPAAFCVLFTVCGGIRLFLFSGVNLDRFVYKSGEKLRCGYTTGSCAAAASLAAAEALLTGAPPERVELPTPKGITLDIPVAGCKISGNSALCSVIKDSGDDPDITNGIEVCARVELTEDGISIDGGEGIGRVTKPGLDQPPGAAAINSVPRKMIAAAVSDIAETCDYHGGFRIVVSVPNGAELASRTYNPLMLDSIARITEEAARLNVVFAVESVDVHPLCTPELLRTVLDTAADIQHCKVIFDPVNLFCAKDGQDKAYQTAHWSRWLEVIGSQLGAVHVKDCRIEADGSKTLLPLGEGDMDYSAIRAFLANRAPAAPLLRDEVILPADTADVRYLRRMTDTV